MKLHLETVIQALQKEPDAPYQKFARQFQVTRSRIYQIAKANNLLRDTSMTPVFTREARPPILKRLSGCRYHPDCFSCPENDCIL